MVVTLLNWLRNLFRDPSPCRHQTNYTERTWVESGTPMAEFFCLDCHYHDIGHVYADARWPTVEQTVRNGVEEERITQ